MRPLYNRRREGCRNEVTRRPPAQTDRPPFGVRSGSFRKLLALTAFLGAFGDRSPVCAQSGFLRYFEAPPEAPSGFRLEGVTFSSGYYSAVLPFGSTALLGPNTPVFGADMVNIVSGSFTYFRRSPTSVFEIVYTPSYERNLRNEQLNTLNHNLSIVLSHPVQLRPRLTVDFSANAGVVSARQYLFGTRPGEPAPGISDPLAGATAGTSAVDALAATTAGGVPIDAATRQLFYGDKVLEAGLHSTFSYSWSPRLRVSVSLGASRYQHLNDFSRAGLPPQSGIVRQTTTGDVGTGLSYSLSPRTNIGMNVDTSRSFSRLQQGFVTTSTFSVSRKMSPNWYLRGFTGVALVNVAGNLPGRGKQPQYVLGGSVGVEKRGHTFVLSPQRTITNTYGVAYDTTEVRGSWSWQSQAHVWLLSSSVGYQRLADSVKSRVDARQGTFAVGRRLASQLVGQAQFTYLFYSGRVDLRPYDFSQRAVLFSLSWIPSGRLSGPVGSNYTKP